MKQRYDIIEIYNGLFDIKRTLATTESLFDAVTLINHLKAEENENPCYSFDFKKIDNSLDENLDWFPCGGLFDMGKVIDCKNYKEFLEKTKERVGQKQ